MEANQQNATKRKRFRKMTRADYWETQATIAFGLLWVGCNEDARMYLSAILSKDQKKHGIAEARSMKRISYEDMIVPHIIGRVLKVLDEAVEETVERHGVLKENRDQTGWLKYRAAQDELVNWAAELNKKMSLEDRWEEE
jgi:hypothetical protein